MPARAHNEYTMSVSQVVKLIQLIAVLVGLVACGASLAGAFGFAAITSMICFLAIVSAEVVGRVLAPPTP